jgi:hypothetical protein
MASLNSRCYTTAGKQAMTSVNKEPLLPNCRKTTTIRRCFLFGPPQDYITRINGIIWPWAPDGASPRQTGRLTVCRKIIQILTWIVKFLCVIYDKRITWRLHIEMIEAKAFRKFVRVCFLFKSECLSVTGKLTLHKEFEPCRSRPASITSYDVASRYPSSSNPFTLFSRTF